MDYISFIKHKNCCVCYDKTVGVDAHHLKAIGMGSNRKKMTDDDHINHGVVPLCRPHHQEYHSIGLKDFDSKYGVNLWKDCYGFLMEYFDKLDEIDNACDITTVTDETFGIS
jgi:hypothetical protein